MKPHIASSELKTILHSKRAHIYYLEHCRVLVNGGRVEYVTEQSRESLYWNIPIANTTCLLLGSGTSITQAAVRELSRAGVMIGFCSGGGTPLLAGTEAEIGCDFFSPQSEYRPTEYLQKWCRFWFDDHLRLQAAKLLQQTRLNLVRMCWKQHEWQYDHIQLEQALDHASAEFSTAADNTALLTAEARLTTKLYALANRATFGHDDFKRSIRGKDSGKETPNAFLDHGNYLAYGLGATACWVLGLPHGLAVLHGKTRRGGLVFDAADIVKDALILPHAFICSAQGEDERGFRQRCISELMRHEALDRMIDTLKNITQLEYDKK